MRSATPRDHRRLPLPLLLLCLAASLAAPRTALAQDCFTRGPAVGPGVCAFMVHTRPVGATGFISGGPNGVPDSIDCVADWDGNGCIEPADIAEYINAWFNELSLGTAQTDLNCDGRLTPTDVAVFVNRWIAAIAGPVAAGC